MENTRAKTTRNSLILLLTATIWGMAFVSQSKGMDYMHPFTFNGVRSLIGAAGILVYILISRKIAGDKAAKLDWKLNVKAGLLCGIFLTIASTLQQFGIKYTSVGKAGFITTLYIIFVPMFGIFLKKKVAPVVWAAAGMAAVGMYLLCMTESLRLGAGDIMVFLCAIAFAIQIMTVDHYAARIDGAVVSCIQFTVCGVVCCIGALIWGQPTFGQIQEGLGALLYAGVLSCGVGYTLQIVGQKGCAHHESGICHCHYLRMDRLQDRFFKYGSDTDSETDCRLHYRICRCDPGTASAGVVPFWEKERLSV